MNADQYYNRAIVELQRGNYKAASELFLMALKWDSKHRPSLHDLAGCYGMMNEWGKAVDYYNRLLILDPLCASAWFNLATILSFDNKNDDALAACDRALTCDPENANIYFTIAGILAKIGRVDEALEYDRQAIKRNPRDIRFLNNYAMHCLYSGTLTPAEQFEIHQFCGRMIEGI